MSGLIPRTGPIHIIPEESITSIMGGPPMWAVGIIPNEEDPEDWVELGSAGGGAECGARGIIPYRNAAIILSVGF